MNLFPRLYCLALVALLVVIASLTGEWVPALGLSVVILAIGVRLGLFSRTPWE